MKLGFWNSVADALELRKVQDRSRDNTVIYIVELTRKHDILQLTPRQNMQWSKSSSEQQTWEGFLAEFILKHHERRSFSICK